MYSVVLNLVVLKATETLILAAAMLRGGTSSQQKEAEAFVEAELAKHNKQRSDRFIKGLKSAVKMDGDGVLVSTRVRRGRRYVGTAVWQNAPRILLYLRRGGGSPM